MTDSSTFFYASSATYDNEQPDNASKQREMLARLPPRFKITKFCVLVNAFGEKQFQFKNSNLRINAMPFSRRLPPYRCSHASNKRL